MRKNSNLIGRKSEFEKLGISFGDIEQNLTLPNPEYIKKKLLGINCSYLPKTISFLKEENGELILPRHYAYVDDFEDEMVHGRTLDVKSLIVLRDYQQEFIEENKDALSKSDGVLLEASCGSGKTVMGIFLSLQRCKQTLVVVPTYYLAEQWKDRINELTDASVTLITSKTKSIPLDSDFTIIALDTYTCRVLPDGFIKNVGHIILDEAHRLGAETYMPILNEIPAKYRTALTATFRRDDNLHHILKYHFGEHFKMASRFPKPLVYCVRTGVTPMSLLSKADSRTEVVTDFLERNAIPFHQTSGVVSFKETTQIDKMLTKERINNELSNSEFQQLRSAFAKAKKLSYTTLDTYLNEHSGRRKTVIKLIRESLKNGRTVLFLSKRKDVLYTLNKVFAEYNPALIISDTKKDNFKNNSYIQNECKLILGVTQLAKEGLDIDRLDTLIIHLPMKDTEQAIGRIARLHPNKKHPICFYLIDNSAVTYSVFNKARQFIEINGDYQRELSLSSAVKVLHQKFGNDLD